MATIDDYSWTDEVIGAGASWAAGGVSPLERFLNRQGGASDSSSEKLTETQAAFLYRAKKDEKSVIGLEIDIKDRDLDGLSSDCPSRVEIIGIDRASSFPFRVFRFVTPDGRRGSVSLAAFETVKPIKVSTKEKMEYFFGDLYQSVNKKYFHMERRAKDFDNEKKTGEQRIKSITQQANKLKKELVAYKPHPINKKSFHEELSSIARRKDIDMVGITDENNIMVKTEVLYRVDEKTDKVDSRKKMGSFLFKINPAGCSVKAINLDYIICTYCFSSDDNGAGKVSPHTHRENYSHPNLENTGSVCFGHSTTDVIKMLEGLQFYQLVDFLVIFFSVFPQSGGSPHFPQPLWFKKRMDRKKEFPISNTFKEGIIYEFSG